MLIHEKDYGSILEIITLDDSLEDIPIGVKAVLNRAQCATDGIALNGQPV